MFLVSACLLSLDAAFSASSFLLICSPAFILFPVLDSQGGFRKEILFLALLSTLCVYLRDSITEGSNGLLFFVGVVSVCIIMSHEMIVAYLPYILCAFIVHGKGFEDFPRKAVVIVPAMIVSILLMLFAQGDNQIVVAICDTLKPNLPLDCIHSDTLGSISFLNDGIFSAHDLVFKSISNGGLFVYMVAALLSFFLMFLVWFSERSVLFYMNKNKKRIYSLIGWVLIAFIASAPLFWVVSDSGRLIYIHVSCLSLLTLMATRDMDNMPLYLTNKKMIAWTASFLILANWRLAHWAASIEKTFPLTSMLERFIY